METLENLNVLCKCGNFTKNVLNGVEARIHRSSRVWQCISCGMVHCHCIKQCNQCKITPMEVERFDTMISWKTLNGEPLFYLCRIDPTDDGEYEVVFKLHNNARKDIDQSLTNKDIAAVQYYRDQADRKEPPDADRLRTDDTKQADGDSEEEHDEDEKDVVYETKGGDEDDAAVEDEEDTKDDRKQGWVGLDPELAEEEPAVGADDEVKFERYKGPEVPAAVAVVAPDITAAIQPQLEILGQAYSLDVRKGYVAFYFMVRDQSKNVLLIRAVAPNGNFEDAQTSPPVLFPNYPFSRDVFHGFDRETDRVEIIPAGVWTWHRPQFMRPGFKSHENILDIFVVKPGYIVHYIYIVQWEQFSLKKVHSIQKLLRNRKSRRIYTDVNKFTWTKEEQTYFFAYNVWKYAYFVFDGFQLVINLYHSKSRMRVWYPIFMISKKANVFSMKLEANKLTAEMIKKYRKAPRGKVTRIWVNPFNCFTNDNYIPLLREKVVFGRYKLVEYCKFMKGEQKIMSHWKVKGVSAPKRMDVSFVNKTIYISTSNGHGVIHKFQMDKLPNPNKFWWRQ